jgi:undecaprenyl-diphosphatase
MTLKIIFLGVIQGLTEFLPVSSDGHLALAQNFLHLTHDTVFLDVFLHIGTLAAIIVFFFKDILTMLRSKRMVGLIFIATLATALVAFPLKTFFESLFLSSQIVGGLLVVNGLIVLSTRWFPQGHREPGWLSCLLMGLAQGLAPAPGISRSGMTITTLLAMRVDRQTAIRFSFIASLPTITGAFLFELKELKGTIPFAWSDLAIGLFISFATGLLALSLLVKTMRAQRFHWFGVYAIALGIAAFILNAP